MSQLERVGKILNSAVDLIAGEPVGPCSVCGRPTPVRFFGVPICEPYGAGSAVVATCRWVFVGEDPPPIHTETPELDLGMEW